MKNIIKISLKTSNEVLTDLKKLIGKELICLSSYYGGLVSNTNEYNVKDYTDIFFSDKKDNVSSCSITFDSLLIEDYNLFCNKIKLTFLGELCKREALSGIMSGIVISQTKKFIIEKVEFFGIKYENKSYNSNHIKVDMDNCILFKSSIGEQILVMQSNQARIIKVNCDKHQIDKIINESSFIDNKEIKTYVLQHTID